MHITLGEDFGFPPVELAARHPNGLLAVGGDLSVPRLLAAYRRGIFPWFSAGDPLLWWSPDPRMVLYPAEFKVSRSLGKKLRQGRYMLRVDEDFEAVLAGCAAPRNGETGTWIVPAMATAYAALHRAGHAHSVAVWMEGELAGGLYGVAIGRAFFGESMFARQTDASKIALAHLARQLGQWGYGLIDCQMSTPHLGSLGARTIPRREFTAALANLVNLPHRPGPWQFDHEPF
jgi:leucyl/phenylalanyl-tRNA--protein transferase